MAIKFNIEPYFDDFDVKGADGRTPREKYYKLLFRPGTAVQARELTQLQSILQNQVESFGRHMFKEGSVVIPGGYTIDPNTPYVALASDDITDYESIIGETVTGDTSGVKAKVIYALPSTDITPDTQPATIYVQYIDSGTSNTAKGFTPDENLTFSGGNTANVATDSEFADIPALGVGCMISVDAGVYFVKGTFVYVPPQQQIVAKYTNFVFARVGFQISESIITSATDSSLNDNATGSPNYAAPGAHRYQIKLTLAWSGLDEADPLIIDNFLQVGVIDAGIVVSKQDDAQYAELVKTLARRTYDESGNYTVRPFTMQIKEHDAIYSPGDSSKLIAALDPAKAYVQGYEIETIATTRVPFNKAREYTLFQAASVQTTYGNSIVVNNIDGLPFMNDDGVSAHRYTLLSLKSAVSGGGSLIGTARVRNITFLGTGQYRLYLFDINMNTGSVFDNTKSVTSAGTPPFTADVVLVASKAQLENPARNTMVFKLPFDRVRTLDSELNDLNPDDFNYIYYAQKRFGAATVAADQVQFTCSPVDKEFFEGFNSSNWMLVVVDGTSTGTVLDIAALNASSDVTIAGDSKSVVISNLATYNGDQVALIAPVKRSLDHKTKTLTNDADDFTVQSVCESGDLQLTECDGYSIISVYMAANFGTIDGGNPANIDVTEYYEMHDGQKDNFYDVAHCKVLSSTAFVPTGSLRVTYNYFTHSAGDFFCVDSYAGEVDYEDIPTFNSKINGEIELRSCIDFRPRMKDGGAGFNGTGADAHLVPMVGTTMSTDVQYYLNRIDKVCLAPDGRFGVVEGVSGLNPKEPEPPVGAMTLYKLYLRAYTESPSEVGVKFVDNKRYTMRDIGKIDTRLSELEYYTALSLLESQTASKQIQDSGTGLDRFKNGFIVDSFTNHALGQATNVEYRGAIDTELGAFRPLFHAKSNRLRYDAAGSSNLEKNGDIITLPIASHYVAAVQPYATGYTQINPFRSNTWLGNLDITPSSDQWKDELQTIPGRTIKSNNDPVYDAMKGIIDQTDALGSVWNDWKTTGTGAPIEEIEISENITKTGTTSTGGWTEVGQNVSTTITPTYTQQRTGIKKTLSTNTTETIVGDRVIDVSFISRMRSRIIKFHATGMKPLTTVYAFFDGTPVANYVREITSGNYTNYSDTDDYAVVDGTLTAHPDGAGALTTDINGEIYGEFYIPNNSTLSFSNGQRNFELSDDDKNNRSVATTSARATYYAVGLLPTQNTDNYIMSTRVPIITATGGHVEDKIILGDPSTTTAWQQLSYDTYTNQVSEPKNTWSNVSNAGGDSGGSGSTDNNGYELYQIQGTSEYDYYYSSQQDAYLGPNTSGYYNNEKTREIPSSDSGGGGGDKIICAKLYELGLLPHHIYEADEVYGEFIAQTDPALMSGYHNWATMVVDWMSGTGPSIFGWQPSKELAIRWANAIATPWAIQMAHEMGVRSEGSLLGKFIMKVGYPLSRRFANSKPKGEASKLGVFLTFAVLRGLVMFGPQEYDYSTDLILNRNRK